MDHRKKNFQMILQQLHEYITNHGLQPGDRLPSERELVEQLNVGRSSIREALRALELLGIISTRRGDGTYLADASSHQLIEILAIFLIRDSKTYREIEEMRIFLDAHATKMESNSIFFSYLYNH